VSSWFGNWVLQITGQGSVIGAETAIRDGTHRSRGYEKPGGPRAKASEATVGSIGYSVDEVTSFSSAGHDCRTGLRALARWWRDHG
jgi:hypothetical protein